MQRILVIDSLYIPRDLKGEPLQAKTPDPEPMLEHFQGNRRDRRRQAMEERRHNCREAKKSRGA